MIFLEWVRTYGVQSAKSQFGVADHLVLVVRPGRHVFGVCGNWKGSEPLGTGQSVEQAKAKLRRSLGGQGVGFETEETITE